MKNNLHRFNPELLKTAEFILDQLSHIGADEGECAVSRNILNEIYYESGKISMVRTVFKDNTSIKLLDDKRKGAIALNSFDHSEIQKAIAEALEASQHAAVDDAEGISELIENNSYTDGPNEPNLEKMYSLLDEFLKDVMREFPLISFDSISINHQYKSELYANTNGVCLEENKGLYEFTCMFMARQEDRSSSFNYFSLTFSSPDRALIELDSVRRIFRETSEQIQTSEIKGSFVGDLIATPAFLHSVLSFIQGIYLSDSAIISGTSPWLKKIGEKVAVDNFTFSICPLDPRLPSGSHLTNDGYTAENMAVIQKGRLSNFCLSRYGAVKAGKNRAANNSDIFVVEAGENKLSDMISGIKKGLILGRFSGGNPGPSGEMTGVAKNSYLVEDGKIVGPVSETMISAQLGSMMMNINAISQERENTGYRLLPWVRISGVTISGK